MQNIFCNFVVDKNRPFALNALNKAANQLEYYIPIRITNDNKLTAIHVVCGSKNLMSVVTLIEGQYSITKTNNDIPSFEEKEAMFNGSLFELKSICSRKGMELTKEVAGLLEIVFDEKLLRKYDFKTNYNFRLYDNNLGLYMSVHKDINETIKAFEDYYKITNTVCEVLQKKYAIYDGTREIQVGFESFEAANECLQKFAKGCEVTPYYLLVDLNEI